MCHLLIKTVKERYDLGSFQLGIWSEVSRAIFGNVEKVITEEDLQGCAQTLYLKERQNFDYILV